MIGIFDSHASLKQAAQNAGIVVLSSNVLLGDGGEGNPRARHATLGLESGTVRGSFNEIMSIMGLVQSESDFIAACTARGLWHPNA